MAEKESLQRRLRLGEDQTLELKQVLFSGSKVTAPRREDLADELAALANSRGGTVVLGVDDKSKEILGIPFDKLEALEAWLRELCHDFIKPALGAEIHKTELLNSGGEWVPVIRIEIGRSLFVHSSPGGYFRRIGSSKRVMPPDVLARMFQERSQSRVIRFDESVVPETTPDDLDPELGARFLRLGSGSKEQTYRKLRLVVPDEDGMPRLSVSGVLMACREPQTWLPFAEIQAVSYAGQRTDINYQLDARDIGGPLDSQVVEALHFLRRNISTRATKGLMRSEVPMFSERALFEALVNAVAHRDYSMAGARIRLHLFGDRLELFVPGALANTLTPESLSLRQYSRNELLVSLLARCPVPSGEDLGRSFFMDRRGDGVPIILEESERLSGQAPEYLLIDESEVRLTIRAGSG